MHRFDLVIFDLDGVLADTTPCHSRAYDDLWRYLGIQGPPYASIAGRKTREVVRECTAAMAPTAAQILAWTRFKQGRARAYLATEDVGFPDSRACLETMTRHGARLAVGTGASRTSAHLILKRLHLFDFFSPIVTAEDVKHGKPAPDVYLKVMADAGADPARTLIIEDSPSGLEAALTSAAYAAAVRTGIQDDRPRFLGSFPGLRAVLDELATPHEA